MASASPLKRYVIGQSEWSEKIRDPELALKAMRQVNVENILKYHTRPRSRRFTMPGSYIALLKRAGVSQSKIDEMNQGIIIDTFHTVYDFVMWYSFNHYKEILERKIKSTDVPFICQIRTGKTTKIHFFYCKRCHVIYASYSRPNAGCPKSKCKKEHKVELQRIRRQIKKGIIPRFCENPDCKKVLPIKYPNRRFCSAACWQANYRKQKNGS